MVTAGRAGVGSSEIPESASFTRVGHTTIHRGPVVSLAVADVEGPDGRTYQREVVHHPGAVSVVPLTEAGTVVLVRQYRAALDAWLLELPAGKRDVPGEDPAATAARELVEEVGLRPDHMELLAEFHNSPGFSDEHSLVYLATGLRPTEHAREGIEERHLEVVEMPLEVVPERVASGELRDAKTIIGLLLALRRPLAD